MPLLPGALSVTSPPIYGARLRRSLRRIAPQSLNPRASANSYVQFMLTKVSQLQHLRQSLHRLPSFVPANFGRLNGRNLSLMTLNGVFPPLA
jgi:hypothetical protein